MRVGCCRLVGTDPFRPTEHRRDLRDVAAHRKRMSTCRGLLDGWTHPRGHISHCELGISDSLEHLRLLLILLFSWKLLFLIIIIYV